MFPTQGDTGHVSSPVQDLGLTCSPLALVVPPQAGSLLTNRRELLGYPALEKKPSATSWLTV